MMHAYEFIFTYTRIQELLHSDGEDKFMEGYLGRRPFDEAIDGWVCVCKRTYA